VDSSIHLIGDLAAQIFGAGDGRARVTAEPEPAVWSAFRNSGLAKILALGDSGDIRNASIVLRAAGAAPALVPAAEVVVANWLAWRAGWDEETALPTVVTADDGWPRVPWGRFATAMYFLCDGRIARCSGPATPSRLDANLAGEPRDRMDRPTRSIEQSNVQMDADELLGIAALCRASMMLGSMNASLELTLEHASQRVQFGKPIKQFQAVQQMVAQFAGQAAAATAAVEFAVSDFSVFTAAVAKARVSEAAAVTTEIAHQVCGAMGFTMEFPLQKYSRRLWAWRDEDGSEMVWNRRVGEMILSQASNGLWPLLSDPHTVVEPWQA
jgi:hypothetical protein